MEQVGKQLDAVNEARAGAGEGRGAVDREDASGREAVEAVGVGERLGAALFEVPAAGHRDDHVRIEAAQVLPRDLGRLLAWRTGDVYAAGDPDHLPDPVAGEKRGVEPLEGEHAEALCLRDRGADAVQPLPEFAPQSPSLLGYARGL